MTLLKKVLIAIRIARDDGFRQLGKRTASYFAQKKEPEPHLQLLQQRDDLTVAEVGVWKGDNAQRLCEILDISKLYLIDPYDEYDEYSEAKSNAERLSRAEMEARRKLAEYPFITWITDYSDSAIEKIDDRLDYIYIDGNHSYEFVKADIENYYELLADDGIIAGDDIHFTGVAQAVSEFAVERNLQPHIEFGSPDWYFIKNREMDPSVEYMHTPEDVYDTISR